MPANITELATNRSVGEVSTRFVRIGPNTIITIDTSEITMDHATMTRIAQAYGLIDPNSIPNDIGVMITEEDSQTGIVVVHMMGKSAMAPYNQDERIITADEVYGALTTSGLNVEVNVYDGTTPLFVPDLTHFVTRRP